MQIRNERPEDAAAIREITKAAFAPMPYGDGTESKIIDVLRDSGALTLSLVAVDRGKLVGHVAFSPVRINLKPADWYGLGPVSVAPARQRNGIGQTLIRNGLERLKAIGAKGCVLLGDPNYYSRFGFESDAGLNYCGYPNPNFLRLAIRGAPPKGDVTFDRAFDADS